jgi:hypothetical protein
MKEPKRQAVTKVLSGRRELEMVVLERSAMEESRRIKPASH